MSSSLTARRLPTPVLLAAAVVAALVALLLAAGSVRAAAPITNFFTGPVTPAGECSPEASPSVTAAATRSDFCVAYRIAAAEPEDDDLSRMVIDTPLGFAGEPDRSPQCSDAQFAYDSQLDSTCSAASQIGDALADVGVLLPFALPPTITDERGVLSLAPEGPVFNLEHGANEVARLGIDLRPVATFFAGVALEQPNVKIIVRVTLRPAPEVGLRSIIENLPQTADATTPGQSLDDLPLEVNAFSLRFWGSQAKHPSMERDFAMLGSDCSTDQRGSVDAVSYDGAPTSGASAPYRLTDCDGIPFEPSVEFATTENRPDVTTGTSVRVKFAEFGSPRTAAAVKKTVVTLPEGVAFSGQIASGPAGLPLCTDEQFGATRAEASSCPAVTAVGAVSFKSPVLSRTLNGWAYLGPQNGPGELPKLFLEAEQGPAADAPRVKLVGTLRIDERGRIVTTLDDLPQVLVEEFFLTFRGGSNSVLVTPPYCGTGTASIAASPYNAPNAPVVVDDAYAVDADCAGAGGFAPVVDFRLYNPAAGGTGAFTTTITRPDRSQRIGQTAIDLPPGMLATLKGVPECFQALARQGQCAPETRVGTVTSYAGVGPAPFRAVGAVYLTDRSPGAVAGISLSVPVVFGDVNLGTLNVPGRIEIRAGDLGLRLIADVPERFKGIPLNIQQISVALDRAGFPLNPTRCGSLGSISTITGTEGAVALAPATMEVDGCEKLPFEPQIDASVTGATGQLGRPNVSVRVRSAAGSGALRQAFVTLPKGIGVDLAQIPRSCPVEEFKAGGCAASAIIGKVTGALSIADEELSGDLYLLGALPGKTLPGLGLAFTGRYAGRVTGVNQVDTKTGQLVSAFDVLPDLPLTEFQIDIKGGTGGAVISTRDLCAGETVDFKARFVSHSGPARDRTSVTRCGAPLSSTSAKISARLGGVRKGLPTLVFSTNAPAGKKIKRFDVTMPKGYTFDKRRATSQSSIALKNLTVDGDVSSRRTGFTKLRIELPAEGTTKARVLTRTRALRIRSTAQRRSQKKVVVVVRATYTDNSSATTVMALTPR